MVSSLGLAPIFLLAITAVVFVLCTRCIDIEEAYEFIDGKILVLIFSMLAIGRSLELNGLISDLTANTMVYGAGGYKFTDFLKVGLPLNLIFGLITSSIITYFYI